MKVYRAPNGKRAWFLAALLLGWAAGASAGSHSAISPQFTVDTRGAVSAGALSGRVTGGASRLGLVGATVAAGAVAATTGVNGRYAFPVLGAGEYTVNVSMGGYVTEPRRLTVRVGRTETLDVQLEAVPPAGQRPVVVSVQSQYGEVFPVLADATVSNRYTARVEWNGSPGTVRFQAPNQTLTAGGKGPDVYLDAEFNMRTAFHPVAALIGGWRRSNPLVVTATNGEGMTSPPVTVYPGVFWVPDWVIELPHAEVTLAVDRGGWEFAVDARYPGAPLVGMADVPSWVPFIGGRFGLEATQAILEGEFASVSASGQLALSGGTGFRGGGMGSVAGSLGGGIGFALGEDWYVDGLLKLAVEGKLSGDLGVLECLGAFPAVQAFALTPTGQWVNDRAKLFAEISPELVVQVALGLLSAEAGGLDLGFRGTDVEFEVDITGGVEIDLALGLYVRGYVGGKPKVYMHFPADPEWFKRAEINFVTGVHVKSFFDTTLVRGERVWHVVLYDSAEKASKAAAGMRGAVAEGETVVITQTLLSERNTVIRGPGPEKAMFLGTPATRGGKGVGTVLLANAFSECKPSLAISGGTKLLVYSSDDPAKADLQSTEMWFARDTGTGWSAPVAITADTYLDCAPVVAFDESGNGVAVWQRSRRDNLDDPAAVEPEMEVAYAVLQAGSATWTAAQFLTANAYLDYGARLARGNDGSLLLVWAANAGNQSVGTAAYPTRLLARRWAGGARAWGPELAVVQGSDGIGLRDFAVAWSGSVGEIVYVKDLDADAAIGGDTELYRVSFDGTAFSAPVRLTDDTAAPVADQAPQVVLDGAGVAHLVWLRGAQVLLAAGFDLANAKLVRERGASTGVAGFSLARSPGDSLFIIWPDDPGGQADLYYRVYDPVHRVWGQDGRLTNDTGMEKALIAAFAADGRLVLAYARTAISNDTIEVVLEDTGETVTIEAVPREGATDLMLLEHALGIDLRVSGIDVVPANPAPGTAAEVRVRVSNLGDAAGAGVTVALYDGDPDAGGTPVGAVRALADPLAGQTEASLTWAWAVPAEDRSRMLWAVVDAGNMIVEFVEDNNRASQAVVLADLAVTEVSGSWVRAEVYELSARIANLGVVASGPFTVRFVGVSGEKGELGRVAVPAVTAGWEDALRLEWVAGTTALPLQMRCEIVGDGSWTEFSSANNTSALLLQAPTVQTPPAPTNLASKPEVHRVRLSWTDTAVDEDGFRIIRTGGARGEEEIGFVLAGVTEYVDDSVTPDTGYTYSVLAYNAAGSGALSAPVGTRTLSDEDDDGLPDDWERLHFDGTLAETGASDFDGDGESNLTEYLNGTDPTDAASTSAPENAYTGFLFEIRRVAEQTGVAPPVLTPVSGEALLACQAPAGWVITAGTLRKPDGTAGETPAALTSTAGGNAAEWRRQDGASLAELMADMVSGEYAVDLTLAASAGREGVQHLRFGITVPAYTEADFPAFVSVMSPAPDASDVAAAPLLEFSTPQWGDLSISSAGAPGSTYVATQQGALSATHQVPPASALTAGSTYRLSVETYDVGARLGSATRSTFTVVKAEQTVAFAELTARTYGDPAFTLAATASSGLPVSFACDTPAVASVSGSTVTLQGAGTCTITASQAGNSAWNPATAVARTLVVGKATPVITWATPAAIEYGTALSGTQLNAAADVAGTFTYTPPAGTVLARGSHALNASFAPADSANWEGTAVGRSVDVVDTTAPVVTAMVPTGDAVRVDHGAALTLSFSESVFPGTGAAHIMNADGSLFETIDVAGRGSMSFAGSTVTLSHSAWLAGSAYHVLVDATCIKDAAGNAFAGVVDPGAWRFTARQWEVQFVAGAHGALEGHATQAVNHGGSALPVTATAEPGYEFRAWTKDGVVYSMDNPLRVASVIADMALTAEFAIEAFTVAFVPGAHGSISGLTPQSVPYGGSTTPVGAVPAYGYVFGQWDDSSANNRDNPRTVVNVTTDLTVTALFQAASPVPPNGAFMALVEAAAVVSGRGWWDLTGTYSTTAAGSPLVLTMVHDSGGRITGTAIYTVAPAAVVTMPIKGSVKGSSGSITMAGTLKGADAARTVTVLLTLNLAVDTSNRQLVGRLAGSIRSGGVTVPVGSDVTLPIQAPMDGTWTLRFQLGQEGRSVAGTALLTLSNGVDHAFVVQGRISGATAALNLSGAPADAAAKAIKIRTAITPLEGGWARLESFSGKGYGQTLGW